MKTVSFVKIAWALLALFPLITKAQTVQIGFDEGIPAAGLSGRFDLSGFAGGPKNDVWAPLQEFKVNSAADQAYFTQPSPNIPLFCIELTQYSTSAFTQYTFQPLSTALGSSTATDLAKLFSVAFPSGTYVPTSLSFNSIQAFQLAVWSLTYGGGFGKIDDNVGFQAVAHPGTAYNESPVIEQANEYLKAAGLWTSAPLFSLYALVSATQQDFVIPASVTTSQVIIPEASTYGLLLGAATLALVSIRRRFKFSA